MNLKKIIAAASAFVIVCGSMPVVQRYMPDAAITANAADYEVVKDNYVTYYVYGDHADVVGCSTSALGSVTIKSEVSGKKVTAIVNSTFYNCRSLSEIVIPDSVTSIGISAFGYCENLREINIPQSVKIIGDNAFEHCTHLTSITIPDSVESIGKSCFSDCYRMTSAVLGKGIKIVPNSCFCNDSVLTDIQFNGNIESIDHYAFRSCGFTSFTIPDSVTSIGSYAFYSCKSLSSINLGNNVKNVFSYAFEFCTSLKSIEFPSSVESVGSYAIAECNALESVVFGENVLSIGGNAVGSPYGASAPSKVIIKNPKCTILNDVVWGGYTLGNKNKTVVCAPEGSFAQEYAEDYGYKFEALNSQATTTTTKAKATTTTKTKATTTTKAKATTTTKSKATTTTKAKATTTKAKATTTKAKATTTTKAKATTTTKAKATTTTKAKATTTTKAKATTTTKAKATTTTKANTTKPVTTTTVPKSSKLLYGDVNCDGNVNITDVSIINAYIKGITHENGEKVKISAQGLKNADVHFPGNGIDQNDADAISKCVNSNRSLPYPEIGDANADETIDGRDATVVLTYYASISSGKKAKLKNNTISDVNIDNIIDGRDASTILAYYSKTSVGYKKTIREYIAER